MSRSTFVAASLLAIACAAHAAPSSDHPAGKGKTGSAEQAVDALYRDSNGNGGGTNSGNLGNSGNGVGAGNTGGTGNSAWGRAHRGDRAEAGPVAPGAGAPALPSGEVPEPSTVVLMLAGMAGVVSLSRRRKR